MTRRLSPLRISSLFGAVLVVLFCFLSPLNALAAGVLFSAHMLQHLLLLLIAPALLLLGLPCEFRLSPTLRTAFHPVAGWVCGVGAMWLWHLPALCDAAALRPGVRAFQAVSLLAMGTAFWWPILAPSAEDRLRPLAGVVYLFLSCLACTALGIMITLTPIEVCSAFTSPGDIAGIRTTARDAFGLTAERDRQWGGLLMWVPMCSVYLGAILCELVRWYGYSEVAHE